MTQIIRVLLVEDNPADADLTKESLEAAKLHVDLSVAVDGEEAMAILRREGPHAGSELPDLIILDLNLPKLDGREVLSLIKADPRLKLIPVVVLTSSDAERDVVASYSLGANCYVTKPLDLAAFQSIVAALKGFWFTIVRLPNMEKS